MAIVTAQTSVGTSATLLVTADADGSRAVIYSPSAALYVGGSSVTTSTGFLVPAGGSFDLELAPSEKLYGVAASTTTVYSLETGA